MQTSFPGENVSEHCRNSLEVEKITHHTLHQTEVMKTLCFQPQIRPNFSSDQQGWQNPSKEVRYRTDIQYTGFQHFLSIKLVPFQHLQDVSF